VLALEVFVRPPRLTAVERRGRFGEQLIAIARQGDRSSTLGLTAARISMIAIS
jgi:hypothetical protein